MPVLLCYSSLQLFLLLLEIFYHPRQGFKNFIKRDSLKEERFLPTSPFALCCEGLPQKHLRCSEGGVVPFLALGVSLSLYFLVASPFAPLVPKSKYLASVFALLAKRLALSC